MYKHTLRYAGVGPRDTPHDQLEVMVALAQELSIHGWWLSSGWGRGADQAFGTGAPVDQQTQWVPSAGFNGASRGAPFKVTSNRGQLHMIAAQFHPYWNNMNPYTKELMARNVAILFGDTFEQIVDMVIYWQSEANENSVTSGTNHTRRIAKAHQIPSFNIRIEEERNALCQFVDKLEAGL